MKPDIHAYIRPGAHAHLVGIGGVTRDLVLRCSTERG